MEEEKDIMIFEEEEVKEEEYDISNIPQGMPKPQAMDLLSNKDYVEEKLKVLGRLVPARIIQYHLDRKGDYDLHPFSQEYDAAVLFADISGFSALAESLAKELNCKVNAAEALSAHIGKSLEKMVKLVCDMGGDVIKFAGDAILVLFPVSKFGEDLKAATECCTKVALDMLQLDLKAGGVSLSVHCGLGAGKVIGYHVGGLQNRWEYVITGAPIDQIGSAEPEAEAGEVVVSGYVKNLLGDNLIGSSLPSGNFKVTEINCSRKFQTQPLIFAAFEPLYNDSAEVQRMDQMIRCYVPRPVMQSIDSGHGNWIAELRICSTLFCRLIGLKFNGQDDLEKIQEAVSQVQETIYEYEGTLCRFIVDDKGAGLLLAFGLPPFMHENDPVRATKASLEIHRSIKALSSPEGDLSCSIGVTSGRVFCGTVGGSIRCEYTLHGTLVNLAARYMVAAKDGVFCGEATYQDAKNEVKFEDPVSIKVKGKVENVNVYRPISFRIVNLMEDENTLPQIGRQEEEKAIDEALALLIKKRSFSNVLVFQGEAGIGKTKMVQYAHQRAVHQKKIAFFVGRGADTEKSKLLHIWKPIMYQLIVKHYDKKVGSHLWAKLRRLPTNSNAQTNRMEGNVEAYIGPQFFSKLEDEGYPYFEEITSELKLIVVQDLTKEMNEKTRNLLPLLSMLLPEIIQIGDNETTKAMKGESRWRNLMTLLQAIVLQMSNTSNRKSFVQTRSKAMSSLGLDDQSAVQQGSIPGMGSIPSMGSIGNMGSSMLTLRDESQSSTNLLETNGSADSGTFNMAKKSVKPVKMVNKQHFFRAASHMCSVICIENLQWIDALSLEFLCRLVQVMPRLVFLITCRDLDSQSRDFLREEYVRLTSMPKCTCFRLKKFSFTELKEGMCNWLDVTHIPDAAVSAVFDKSGGQPLFAEELTKLMKMDNIIEIQGNQAILPKDLKENNIGLPDNVSALMTAKLDRISPSQQHALKHMSVIGMEFYKHELYEIMASDDNAINYDIRHQIDDDIDELIASGLLVKTSGLGNRLAFQNVMLRDSAYNLLLFKNRKDLHLKLAQYYEERNKGYMEIVWELLSYHYYMAEEYKTGTVDPITKKGKAIIYLELAGDDALSVHAMEQAYWCFNKLLTLDNNFTKDIGSDSKVLWNLKAGEALIDMGKADEADSHFYQALVLVGLDLRTIEAKKGWSCFGGSSTGKPRLVSVLPKFAELKENQDIQMILAGAKVFSLMSRFQDRASSAFVLETYMNAILLAELASELAEGKAQDLSKEAFDEVSGELAKIYARAAVFYIGAKIKQSTNLAAYYSKSALSAVAMVENSEIQASVFLKCAEYSTIIGNLDVATKQLKKATWICKFVNFESMLVETVEHAITTYVFEGKFGKACKEAQQAYDTFKNLRMLPIWARVAILYDDVENCEWALELACRAPPGSFNSDTERMFKILEGQKGAEVNVAFSLLLSRKYRLHKMAILIALRAAKSLLELDISDVPIRHFHTFAFALQALYEAIEGEKTKVGARRSSLSSFRMKLKVIPADDPDFQLSTAETVASNILRKIKKYAVYIVCTSHIAYCSGLVEMLNGKAGKAKKCFIQAANLSASMKIHYVEGISYFQMLKIDGTGKESAQAKELITKAIEAFEACVDTQTKKGESKESKLYELNILKVQDTI